ncbi:hypothetical protein [Flammeovirga sp. SubArs3]|uniref:hypothetical protein n=1 Tax=Flammeovirga sp. SubArs3 TaxID=2995316 RepID=UPI00248BEDFE|nr:hypothetical protein [Flammeovirga sp. SubArs3]
MIINFVIFGSGKHCNLSDSHEEMRGNSNVNFIIALMKNCLVSVKVEINSVIDEYLRIKVMFFEEIKKRNLIQLDYA